jgi:hypothetical protein
MSHRLGTTWTCIVVACAAGCDGQSRAERTPALEDAPTRAPVSPPIGPELGPGALVPALSCKPCLARVRAGSELRAVRVELSGKRGQLVVEQPDTAMVQRLEIDAASPSEAHAWQLTAADVNFDGFLDLQLIKSSGVANAYAQYWRFVAETQAFEDLGTFPVFTLHASERQLTTHERNGSAGLAYEDREYRIEAGKPVLWRQERQAPGTRAGTFEKTVAVRDGRELKTVERKNVTAP